MPLGTGEQWRADGVDLMNLRHWIESVDNREAINGRRQPTWEVPFRQGTPPIWDAAYTAKTITLNMVIGDTDASGAVTFAGGRRAHLRDNLNEIIATFSKRGSAIAMERDVPAVPGPGNTTWTAEATVINQASFSGVNKQLRSVSIGLFFPWPFWTGGPVTIPALSPVTIDVEGTAPTWPTLYFHEAGRAEVVGTEHWVEAPAGTTVDCRNKTVTPRARINVGSSDWMMLLPGENHLDGPRFDVTVTPQWH